MNAKKLVSIIIPLFNEQEVVEELGSRLKAMMDRNNHYDFEAVMVENGSGDLTYKKLVELHKGDGRFKVLRLSRNFTVNGGMSAGLKYAKGDAAVIMTADLQDPPEVVPDFIKKWEEGYEIVYGVIKKREGMSLTRRLLSSLFYRIMNWLTAGLFPLDATDFRLVDKKVYKAINTFTERNRFLRGMIIWTGFSQIGVPFERAARFAGESKATYREIFSYAMNGIYAFSYFPLKVVTALGITLSSGSFLAMIVYIFLFVIYGQKIPGLTTLLTLTLFLFGMLFLILGIMGEYLSRIYDEVKQRPNFIVREEIGL